MEQGKRNLLTENEFREQVALRAYELYEDRGGQHGRDIDDWLQAETDVRSEAEQQQKISPGRKQPSGTISAEVPQRARKTQRPASSSG
jgi:hypothetical protein